MPKKLYELDRVRGLPVDDTTLLADLRRVADEAGRDGLEYLGLPLA